MLPSLETGRAPAPAAAAPPRRPGSVRRTTTHDSLRPAGLSGPVTVLARGRDLRTSGSGTTVVLDAARLEAQAGYPDRVLTSISTDPHHPGSAALVGARASGGFRRAVAEALPEERGSHSVRFQLLDDLPTALLVSGYAVHAGGAAPTRRPAPMLQHPDLCAGWITGGTAAIRLSGDEPGPMDAGPLAPAVERADDPMAWHDVEPLPPHSMRRRRRLDVWEEDGHGQLETFFRDSHVDGVGVERVVHEYTVRGTVDLASMRLVSCTADFGALPWPECPAAVASAGRLAGTAVDGLRHLVRKTFVGPSTCTHLNDTLRSLEDVAHLLSALR